MFHPDIVCVLKERKRVGIFNPQVFAGCHNRKTAQKNNKPHTHTHTHTHTQMHTYTHRTERELSRVSRVWSKACQRCRPPELGSELWLHHSRWKCHRLNGSCCGVLAVEIDLSFSKSLPKRQVLEGGGQLTPASDRATLKAGTHVCGYLSDLHVR